VIREKMRTTTVAVPGSPIAQTDRGRHSRPGVDEPYEPVVLRGSPTGPMNGPSGEAA
jgi:hypothetical protein